MKQVQKGGSHEKRAGMNALGFHGNDCLWYRVVTVVLK